MAVKIRKTITSLLLGLLALITIGLAVRAIANYATGQKLAAYLKEAKATGVPMTVKALVPDCPDADNAAPLWKAVEALLHADVKDKGLLGRVIDDFFSGRPLDDKTRLGLTRLVESGRRALDLLAEASTKPCFRSFDWRRPAYEMTFRDIVDFMIAARLLAGEAVLLADKGDIPGALERCRIGLRASRRFLDEPVLLRGLVAMAATKIDLIAAERVFAGREVDQAVTTAWMKELDPEAWRKSFARVIPGERAFGLETGLALVRGNTAPMDLSQGARFTDRIWIWMIRPLLKSQILRLQKAYDGLAKIAGRPFYQQREGLAEIREQLQAGSRSGWLIGTLLPDYEAPFMKQASLEAMMLVAKAGLACRLYRNKTGRFPESLEALVPEYLDRQPVDPFTGKPLVYRLSADELLVYSLGSNQKDDGGRETYMIVQLVAEKDDDWTWREMISPAR